MDTLTEWDRFYSHFQSSRLSQTYETDTALVKKAGASLLIDTGKSFASDLFKSCGLFGGDVVKFNHILWQLEEKCLPQVAVMFENFKRSSDIPEVDVQPSLGAESLPEAEVYILNKNLKDNFILDGAVETLKTDAQNVCNRDNTVVCVKSDTPIGRTAGSRSKSVKVVKKSSNNFVRADDSVDQGKDCVALVRRSGRNVKISSRFQDVGDRILKTIKGEFVTDNTSTRPESEIPPQLQDLSVTESKGNIGGVSTFLYSCDLCQETFSFLGSVHKHLLSHQGLSVKHQLCLFCGKTFKLEKLLEAHIRKKHGKECHSGHVFQCPKCPKKFKTKEQLDFHSVRHAEVKPYFCEVCGKSFLREKGLMNHMRMHEGGGFMCAVCGKSFISQRVMMDHSTVHTGERPHVCDVCGKSFRLKANLHNHKHVHNPNKNIQCPHCPKSFRESRSFSRHLLMHTGERPWRCKVCGKGFVQEITLKKHMNLHNGENRHQCQVCLRSFVDKWGLIKHSTIHTGERPYKCTVCDRSFRMKRGLEDHFKLHDTSLQLKCPLCPKTFVEKRHLDHHLRVHRGEKAYVCEICGDRFVNSMSLKVHHRRHTGEKPYKCSYCPKTFNQHGTHAAHERLHRGERPYACDFCDAAFITHSQLNIHRRKHLNIRPYKCPQCDYAATTASLLKVHALKHSIEKPFRCPVCPAAFKRQNHLDVHARKHQAREDNTSIIHISEANASQQPEPVPEGGAVTVVEVFQCSLCEATFPGQAALEKHMKRHEIIVVTAPPNQDGIFEVPAIEGAHGASSEVAYDIVLL